MENLYEKFNVKIHDINLGYDLFTKMEPNYILIPKLKDREKCLCKKHEDFRLLCSKFEVLKVN